MANRSPVERQLVHMAFLQREEGFTHHAYNVEMLQYEYLRDGDMRSIEALRHILTSGTTGCVSEDPLRNRRYLFVANTTLATRFAIEGGMEPETAYTLSDLFIRRMDALQTMEEVVQLNMEMFETFTRRMADIHKNPRYSRLVLLALDYIYTHLQEPLTADDVARGVGRSRAYLSVLFKREVGVGVAACIRNKRVEAAQNMLKFSDFTLQEIADYLAFSSQSHFSAVFREQTGLTPGAYREKYFRRNFPGRAGA